MGVKEIEKKIMDIIKEINEEIEIDESTLLLEEEVLDSVSMLYLVTELENEYKIQIPLDAVTEDNFKNIDSIVKYVFSLI
jgi:acyl carrier protein